MSADEELFQRLINLRGGCGCGHPASPPCWACSNPATTAEIADLAIDQLGHGPAKAAALIHEAEPDETWLTEILQKMVPSITKREFYNLQDELIERGYDANI